jgi:translocation and assembly module TamB
VIESERFQRESRTLALRLASSALKRPVSFSGLSFSIIPPAVTIENVRVAGAPGETQPFFESEQISVTGAFAFVGRTLSFGSVRVRRPRLHLVVFPDGSNNLPPGLSAGPKRPAIKVKIGGLSVIGGEFLFNETRVPLNLDLKSFVAELISIGPANRFRGRLACRTGSLALPGGVSFPFRLSAGFDLGGGRLHLDNFRLTGPFGNLTGGGEIPHLSKPEISLLVAGRVDTEKLEQIFHLTIPFHGGADIDAHLTAGGGERFHVAGRAAFGRLEAQGFVFENLTTVILAGPGGLTARIENGTFDGGAVEGIVALGPFREAVQRYQLLVESRGISLERFFGNLDLPGTGLAAGADVRLALAWNGGDIEKGNGGGQITLVPGSLSGARAVALSGEGSFSIRSGMVNFQGLRVQFPRSTLVLDGGFALGVWDPRLRFALTSEDFRSVDRLATNFSMAIKRAPADLYGLAGKGRIEGALTGRWSLPEVSGRLSAEDAEYSGLRLGTVFWDFSVADEAFFFRPLRAYDGDVHLSLSGFARYRSKPGSPQFDLTVEAARFPVERILKYLDFDLPVTGRITGTLPIAGNGSAMRGNGKLLLDDAVFYGQPVSRVSAEAVFEPGTVTFEGIRGQVGSAWFSGDVAFKPAERHYRFRAAADAVPVSAIAALSRVAGTAGANVSFHAQGEGTFDHPSLSAELTASGLTFEGRPLPEEASPQASLGITEGRIDLKAEAPGHWFLEAHGDLSAANPALQCDLRVSDLGLLPALFPDLPHDLRGELAAAGTVQLDAHDFSVRSVRTSVSRLKIASPREGPPLEEAAPFEVLYADGKISIPEARFSGAGSQITIAGTIDTERNNALSATVRAEGNPAALVAYLLPGTELSGDLTANLTLRGTLARPETQGLVQIENGRLRSSLSPNVFDGISGSVHFSGDRARLDGLRARVAGGTVNISGDAKLSGLSLTEFRLLAQAENVTVRSIEGLTLQANADLTVVGDSGGAVVRGDLTLVSGTYTKEFGISVASLFGPSRALAEAEPPPEWEEKVRLEIRIVSAASLEVRTNLARLTAAADLLVRGTMARPVLLGQLTVDEGGRLTFQDVKYEIQSATVTFGNPFRTEPVIDITASAQVKGYDITVRAAGTLGERSRVQFSFSSNPPLSDQSVTSLLLTGSTPEETAIGGRVQPSTTSTVVGSVAGLAFRPVTSQVEQLFRLDKFQIDPVLQSAPGSTGGAVITVGKNVTKDLSVVYSYSAEQNAQSILLIEYQIDANKILQISKDVYSVYSIDIKLRKRF